MIFSILNDKYIFIDFSWANIDAINLQAAFSQYSLDLNCFNKRNISELPKKKCFSVMHHFLFQILHLI